MFYRCMLYIQLRFMSEILKALSLYPIAFRPRIDSERKLPFLPDEPPQLVSSKQFNRFPFINGLNSNVGGIFVAGRQNNFFFIYTYGNYNNVLCINYISITTSGGMAQLKKDQINSVLYSNGIKKRKDGYEIAKKSYQHYFGGDATSDNNIYSVTIRICIEFHIAT